MAIRQKTRLTINVLSNYAAFFVYGISNFILAGFVVRQIGKDAFGIVSLVMSLTILTEFLGRGVCQALVKYLAGELVHEDHQKLNNLINTSFAWLVGCGVIGAAVCITLVFYVDRVFTIPPQLRADARAAMWLMAIRVITCFPLNTFQSILWAHQRYDLTNIFKIIAVTLRLVLVVLYFELVSAGIVELIVITIITLLVERGLWIIWSYRIYHHIRIGISFVNKKIFRILLGFGGLILIIDISNMLGYEAVKWVIGHELTVKDAGAYTLIATLAAFAGSLVRSMANVLMPVASKYSELKQQDKNVLLAMLSTKYALIISGMVCIVPLFFLKSFMHLWVGESYAENYLLLITRAGIIMLIGQWFISIASCTSKILTGMGKIKIPAYITMAWALGGLSGIWLYLHYQRQATVLAAVVGITIARMLGASAQVLYAVVSIRFKTGDFLLKSILSPGVVSLLTCFWGGVLAYYFNINKPLTFICFTIVLLLSYAIGIWFITLTGAERNGIKGKIRQIIQAGKKIAPRYNKA